MRRFIDFENRVFAKYAGEHDLPFNDVAAVYPRDPRLFVDSIHMTPAGIKLKAWLVFQNLVRVLEPRLSDSTLPMPDPAAAATIQRFQGRRAGSSPSPPSQRAAACRRRDDERYAPVDALGALSN